MSFSKHWTQSSSLNKAGKLQVIPVTPIIPVEGSVCASGCRKICKSLCKLFQVLPLKPRHDQESRVQNNGFEYAAELNASCQKFAVLSEINNPHL